MPTTLVITPANEIAARIHEATLDYLEGRVDLDTLRLRQNAAWGEAIQAGVDAEVRAEVASYRRNG